LSGLPEWISAIAESATALSLFLVWDQIKIAKKQLHDDHERSRRQAAIDILLTWTKTLTPSTSSVRRLVDSLDQNQCKALEHIEEIDIDIKQKELLKSCFGEPQTFREDAYRITLTRFQSSELRYRIINYLNTLESIFSSWHHSVADRDIIGEQFQYMLEAKEGHTLLKKFRVAAGEENYPAIGYFEEFYQTKPGEGKKPLGS
jgi:hypothetical protein